MENGLISNVLSWGTHPTYSEGTAVEWFWGLILLLIVVFFWTMILKEIK